MGKPSELERAPRLPPSRRSLRSPTAAAPGVQDRLLDARGKPVETAVEPSEIKTTGPRKPDGLGHGQAVEAVDPALADAEGDGPRQPLVHGVGGKTAELVLARPLEKLAEAFDASRRFHSAQGLARHLRRGSRHDEPGQAKPHAEDKGRPHEAPGPARED